ncbi:MAG: SRPBCC family protein [Candidatus Acidiferrales bacterium]
MSEKRSSSAAQPGPREIVITRIFDAPRDLVFEAWTNPKHVAQWWGPKGFTTTIQEMDVRPGGVWRLVMHGPDGADYKNKMVVIEVAKPERLVYKHTPEGAAESENFEVTINFIASGGKTEVTMRMLFPSAEARENVAKKYGAIDGINQTLDRLAQHLAKS